VFLKKVVAPKGVRLTGGGWVGAVCGLRPRGLRAPLARLPGGFVESLYMGVETNFGVF